jgi:hypothetical protein
MIDLLLYSSLACTDAAAIMVRMRRNEDLNHKVKVELVEAVQEATPECMWDEND